jgi:hypothetical protein
MPIRRISGMYIILSIGSVDGQMIKVAGTESSPFNQHLTCYVSPYRSLDLTQAPCSVERQIGCWCSA